MTILDFNNDGYIDQADVQFAVDALVGFNLTEEEKDMVVEKVFEEADIDGDKRLSYVEFEHIISRAPDFIKYETKLFFLPQIIIFL